MHGMSDCQQPFNAIQALPGHIMTNLAAQIECQMQIRIRAPGSSLDSAAYMQPARQLYPA